MQLGSVCLQSLLFCYELCPFLHKPAIHPKQLIYELKIQCKYQLYTVLFVTNELVSLIEISITISGECLCVMWYSPS